MEYNDYEEHSSLLHHDDNEKGRESAASRKRLEVTGLHHLIRDSPYLIFSQVLMLVIVCILTAWVLCTPDRHPNSPIFLLMDIAVTLEIMFEVVLSIYHSGCQNFWYPLDRPITGTLWNLFQVTIATLSIIALSFYVAEGPADSEGELLVMIVLIGRYICVITFLCLAASTSIHRQGGFQLRDLLYKRLPDASYNDIVFA